MPETPVMTLRVDDEMKARWQLLADELGVKLSDLIRDTLEERVNGTRIVVVHPPPASESLGVAETRKSRKARRR